MDALTRMRNIAREVLTIEDGAVRDPWLWEHAGRITQLTQRLADLPEYAPHDVSRTALQLAGLFGLAGWAVQVREGEFSRWQVLGRPTSGVQREHGAALLQEHAAPLLAPNVIYRATEAIRECSDRKTDLPEARVLSDAENLADMGLIYILRQFRQATAEGRPFDDLVAKWQRQREYHYWDARIKDGLHSEGARQIARDLLAEADHFVIAMAIELAPGKIDD